MQQAELRLDTRIEMLRGGKSGPAILENDPAKSLLIQRISGSEAGMQMPPTGPLTEKEIETLVTWVRAGAPWDAGASFTKERSVSPEARELFEAIRRGQIPAMRKILGRNPELVHALDENGSTPLLLATQNTGKSGSGSAAAKAQQREILRLLEEHGAT